MKKHLLLLAVSLFVSLFLSAQAPTAKAVQYGKYGCTASTYKNGYYEFLPKGSFVLAKGGSYTYLGFSKPSSGTFKVDGASGVISFRGGYFDKGVATPIEGKPNRYYLVFPTIAGGRWTCGLTEEKK
ncbi:hypothetical protein [Flavisolibacter nicotianae]|uniref:hypothetical protein n=1 Tax=Flavisolibacter nicotianae TaxID=2364882 RepID=UPI000EACB73D|nr:hypothetical protein [Flavisolibacter nicotianae]